MQSHAHWSEIEYDVDVTSKTLLAKQWRRSQPGATCKPLTARRVLNISRMQ